MTWTSQYKKLCYASTTVSEVLLSLSAQLCNHASQRAIHSLKLKTATLIFNYRALTGYVT